MSKYPKILAIELVVLTLELRCVRDKKEQWFYRHQNLLNQSVLVYKHYSGREYRKLRRSLKIFYVME